MDVDKFFPFSLFLPQVRGELVSPGSTQNPEPLGMTSRMVSRVLHRSAQRMTETMEYWAAEELGESDLRNLHECEKKVTYQFRDLRFLHQALTHSSIKTLENPSNERLEFLGDSVLGLVMTEFLYNFFQHHDEGELTQIKSVVVSTNVLAAESQRLGLGAHYNVGKGVTRRKKLPNSLLANVFEAVVAAIYKDGGLEVARRFILRNIYHQVLNVASDRHHRNYKSLLQQWAQRVVSLTPTYRVVSEQGPDHLKSFEVVAVIGDKRYAIGAGAAKKEAEQEAARKTLKMLDETDSPLVEKK